MLQVPATMTDALSDAGAHRCGVDVKQPPATVFPPPGRSRPPLRASPATWPDGLWQGEEYRRCRTGPAPARSGGCDCHDAAYRSCRYSPKSPSRSGGADIVLAKGVADPAQTRLCRLNQASKAAAPQDIGR